MLLLLPHAGLTMGVGSIFVATTLAPVVVVLASVSLNLLTIGLDQLSKCEKQVALLFMYMCVIVIVWAEM